eukprot:Hpha_TRINITY_DN15991_c0_g3::TRINITY_DN15991_c0_g3_i1::g.74597::m.74597/K00091/E1.1.1.219; dihydroflavonol-4-reductase
MQWLGTPPRFRLPTIPDKMQCFVTGCCGFVGTNLVERLLASGWSVTGMDVKDSTLKLIESFPGAAERFKFIEGDVGDKEAVMSAVPEGCHYFFHLASNTAVRAEKAHLQNMTNIRGTEHVVEACRQKGVGRLILTSSIAVYFPYTHDWESWFPPKKKKVVLNEEMRRSPHDFWVNYCRTKALQEDIVLEAKDVDTVIVQPSDIIGKFDERSWGRLLRMMAECRLVGIPRADLNFVNVSDVVEGHLRAAVAGKKGESYVLGGTNFSTAELAAEMQRNIRRILGVTSCQPQLVPLWLLRLMGYLQEWLDDDPLAGSADANTPEADKSFPPETIFLLSSQHETCSDKARTQLMYQHTTRRGVLRAIRQMANHALLHVEPIPAPVCGEGSIRGSVRRLLARPKKKAGGGEEEDDCCALVPEKNNEAKKPPAATEGKAAGTASAAA